MKKCLIVLFLFFSTVALAKTWEANLQSCDGYGGFWFPNHNWTDKGEPWIKPFMDGESLENYKETGISFNYDLPGWSCKTNNCPALYNPFLVKWSSISSDKSGLHTDSIYFFVENYKCEYSTIESFSIDDFALKVNNGDENCFSLESYYYDNLLGAYFVYKKYSDKFEYNALCQMKFYTVHYSYEIQCEFQDDGTLNFYKLPDVKTIPEDFCSTQSIPSIRWNRFGYKNGFTDLPFYKVNGTPATKNSSNIVIQNKQPKLWLKGN